MPIARRSIRHNTRVLLNCTPMATDGSIHFCKRELRSQMKRRLGELQPAQREAKSREICQKVINKFADTHTVAAFASTRFEPNLETLWTRGFFVRRLVLYPKIDGNNLVFCPVASGDDLRPGRFGILEPVQARAQLIPDVILVPGLAFTSEGHRLGRGVGFYDRFLGTSPSGIIKAGICFDFQVVPELPAESHDVRMDLVITG
jgi:5-formyltetrahydrofolate cyclo-ligase